MDDEHAPLQTRVVDSKAAQFLIDNANDTQKVKIIPATTTVDPAI
jgi:hypothetical protein